MPNFVVKVKKTAELRGKMFWAGPDPDPNPSNHNVRYRHNFNVLRVLKCKKVRLPSSIVQGLIGLKLNKICNRLGLALLLYRAPKQKSIH